MMTIVVALDQGLTIMVFVVVEWHPHYHVRVQVQCPLQRQLTAEGRIQLFLFLQGNLTSWYNKLKHYKGLMPTWGNCAKPRTRQFTICADKCKGFRLKQVWKQSLHFGSKSRLGRIPGPAECNQERTLREELKWFWVYCGCIENDARLLFCSWVPFCIMEWHQQANSSQVWS